MDKQCTLSQVTEGLSLIPLFISQGRALIHPNAANSYDFPCQALNNTGQRSLQQCTLNFLLGSNLNTFILFINNNRSTAINILCTYTPLRRSINTASPAASIRSLCGSRSILLSFTPAQVTRIIHFSLPDLASYLYPEAHKALYPTQAFLGPIAKVGEKVDGWIGGGISGADFCPC